MIYRKRNKVNAAPAAPLRVEDLTIPEEFKTVVVNGMRENILVADRRPAHNRIIFCQEIKVREESIFAHRGEWEECLTSCTGLSLGSGRPGIQYNQFIVTDVTALRDMHIKVPQAVRVGDSVTLACDYDLEQVALYTIKWYRNDVEFYRFVPKESPPSREFVVEHVNVDKKEHCFELLIRGISPQTTQELRRTQLRGALAKEKVSSPVSFVVSLDSETNISEIKETINDLRKLLLSDGGASAAPTATDCCRIRSRLLHLSNPIDLLPSSDVEDKSVVSGFVFELMLFEGLLLERTDVLTSTESSLTVSYSTFATFSF
ncbi:hypothetical protein FQR65_LT09648 [Abscondita terminalis]|nr:hypothetical protein FQR65_LT09648 [Abscondita terminalis]